MAQHISSEYISFIRNFILLQFQSGLQKNTSTRDELFEKYANHIHYYHELLKINTINKYGNNYELVDFFQINNFLDLFVHTPFVHDTAETQLSSFTPLNIYNGTPNGVSEDVKGLNNQLKGNPSLEDCPISNVHRCIKADPDLLVSFQDYVDEIINIKNINMMEYQHFIKLMKEAEFRKTLHKKYVHDMELRVIKKSLNNEIDKIMEDIGYGIAFLDVCPYYEYKTHSSNETLIKEIKLYELEIPVLREIEQYIE